MRLTSPQPAPTRSERSLEKNKKSSTEIYANTSPTTRIYTLCWTTEVQSTDNKTRPRDRANGPGARHTKRKGFRMQSQATVTRDGTLVAHGYGLKIYVDKGHLVVHDGIGRDR